MTQAARNNLFERVSDNIPVMLEYSLEENDGEAFADEQTGKM